VIPPELWEQVFVGIYNGATIVRLDAGLRRRPGRAQSSLFSIGQVLNKELSDFDLKLEIRAQQITLAPRLPGLTNELRNAVSQILESESRKLKVMASSHSVDVIDASTSKVNVVHLIEQELTRTKRASAILCIGDRGDFGGNDSELLALPLSLSVDKVSGRPDSCWHIAPPGVYGSKAFEYYLAALKIEGGQCRFRSSPYQFVSNER
jgi:hypothetical protein